jgi:hypothetical protein
MDRLSYIVTGADNLFGCQTYVLKDCAAVRYTSVTEASLAIKPNQPVSPLHFFSDMRRQHMRLESTQVLAPTPLSPAAGKVWDETLKR